jgi:hypothetical protein
MVNLVGYSGVGQFDGLSVVELVTQICSGGDKSGYYGHDPNSRCEILCSLGCPLLSIESTVEIIRQNVSGLVNHIVPQLREALFEGFHDRTLQALSVFFLTIVICYFFRSSDEMVKGHESYSQSGERISSIKAMLAGTKLPVTKMWALLNATIIAQHADFHKIARRYARGRARGVTGAGREFNHHTLRLLLGRNDKRPVFVAARERTAPRQQPI